MCWGGGAEERWSLWLFSLAGLCFCSMCVLGVFGVLPSVCCLHGVGVHCLSHAVVFVSAFVFLSFWCLCCAWVLSAAHWCVCVVVVVVVLVFLCMCVSVCRGLHCATQYWIDVFMQAYRWTWDTSNSASWAQGASQQHSSMAASQQGSIAQITRQQPVAASNHMQEWSAESFMEPPPQKE